MAELSKLADDPLWFRNAVCYEIYVRVFYDSNGDHPVGRARSEPGAVATEAV
ncbi:MAG: hypothetical protein ACRD9R_04120 [Pyrinomonadaceae bacterium]